MAAVCNEMNNREWVNLKSFHIILPVMTAGAAIVVVLLVLKQKRRQEIIVADTYMAEGLSIGLCLGAAVGAALGGGWLSYMISFCMLAGFLIGLQQKKK